MPAKTSIFFTGATGFVGGSVLNALLEHKNFANFDITALVRSADKAEKLQTLGLSTVIGSNEDEQVLEDAASKAEIVMNLAGDWLAPTQALLRGAKRQQQASGHPTIFIHVSGTGVFADNAIGAYSSDTIYSDNDLEKLEALDPTAVHRDAEVAVIGADTEGYVKSYIVSPSYVYGHPQNKLTELGIQNDTNLVLKFELGVAKERGAIGILGKGINLFGIVDNTELAQLFILIFDSALAEPSTAWHGREGYYIASEDEFTWGAYMQAFAEGLAEAGALPTAEVKPFTEEEIAKWFPPQFLSVFGGNCRTTADRSKALGWKPTSTLAKFLQHNRAEGVRMGKAL